ncbi:pre-rRNA-processing protein TSR2 homolog isoform X2 [Dysidea avara]|uniref:pre-rRNA-processing protein TSR2 homolog isoform X2 n=1 Tax=Dysidea avara TaxID=196820 RepID=UPI003333182B
MAKAEAPKWTESFREGVAKIMGQWKGLQMAVDHQFGGLDSKEKGTWLMEVAGSFMLENDDVDKDELEEYLSILMDQEFDTILEDGSTLQNPYHMTNSLILSKTHHDAQSESYRILNR